MLRSDTHGKKNIQLIRLEQRQQHYSIALKKIGNNISQFLQDDT